MGQSRGRPGTGNLISLLKYCLQREQYSSSSHYCNKLKSKSMYSSMCLLGSSQHTYFCNSGNVLELMFSSVTDFFIYYDVHSVLHNVFYHPLLSQN
jgi:hypothetical protein